MKKTELDLGGLLDVEVDRRVDVVFGHVNVMSRFEPFRPHLADVDTVEVASKVAEADPEDALVGAVRSELFAK